MSNLDDNKYDEHFTKGYQKAISDIRENNGYMTGREWYTAFESNLYKLAQRGNFVFMDETIDEILDEAKRAAGIE